MSAADQAIEGLLRDPAQRRLAVLLDGLAAELRACSPVATMEDIPARRWADLWARAVLLSHATPQPADPETVSGRLLILGVDLHEHATAVQAQVHAVLEPQGRLVRASVTAAKVDTITDQAVWGLFSDHPVLMGALAKNLTLDVTDLPLVGGDLRWDEAKAKVGELANPFTTARVQLAEAVTTAITPLDRHPVMIGEPVLVEGYTVKDGAIHLGGHALAVEGDLPRSTACIGLLRWDAGQWSLRPLAVQTKSKTTHNGDNALNPGKSDAVGVLRERAGRLLRK
ncbi:MAG: hypothetical protein HOY71_31325 [Nonomuraea sp.]|nr:hypothetical protein [Nonomuraea sp.]